MTPLLKYPRTPHVEGSRTQPGDGGLDTVPLSELRGRTVVIEEKIDGANAALRFTSDGELLLQSRGHYLTGGPRERQFDPLKRWAAARRDLLWRVLGCRYVLYGEWTYALHSIFYDALPHYFLEFDVLDTATGEFLATPERQDLLRGTGVVPVPVLHQGPWEGDPARWIGRSCFQTPEWRQHVSPARAALCDGADLAEGLYFKCEEQGRVTLRAKFVRASFSQAVAESGSHWLDRPLVPNRLAPGLDLFTP